MPKINFNKGNNKLGIKTYSTPPAATAVRQKKVQPYRLKVRPVYRQRFSESSGSPKP